MDFFRPVRSTDPLVDRPVAEPGPKIIRREKTTSLPPALKESPNAKKERDVYNLAKLPVYPSSIIVEDAVAPAKKSPHYKEPAPKPPKPRSNLAEKEFDLGGSDDWFDSLKSEGFFTDVEKTEPTSEKKVKLDKELSKKPLYTFTGESPFLKSVQVEKRPLSRFTPVSKSKDLPPPPPPTPKPTRREKLIETERRPSDKATMPFWVIILITIVLGIASGVAVFVLIS